MFWFMFFFKSKHMTFSFTTLLDYSNTSFAIKLVNTYSTIPSNICFHFHVICVQYDIHFTELLHILFRRKMRPTSGCRFFSLRRRPTDSLSTVICPLVGLFSQAYSPFLSLNFIWLQLFLHNKKIRATHFSISELTSTPDMKPFLKLNKT